MEQRVERKLSVVYAVPDLAVDGQPVSADEADFFVENGFFVKRGMLDAAAVDAALDATWAHLVDRVPVAEGADWTLRRDDPHSWRGPRWAPMPPVPKSGPYEGRQPIVHAGATVKLHDLGDADCLVDLLPNNPAVRRVAAALLGDDLRPSTRTRGVYAIFPPASPSPLSGAALGPHTDRVCQQLNACAYLADVAPRSGGFTVYPGSHRIMFRAHRWQANWSPLPSFRAAMRRVVAEIEPVELIGGKGDVIFWHGRTVHSSGIHNGDGIRWALFADFTRDQPALTPDEHRSVGQFEWFKDTALFRDDAPATGDMWRHWRIAARRRRAPTPCS